jgi:hypothetical protein
VIVNHFDNYIKRRENTMKNKAIFVIIALLMVLTAIPVAAYTPAGDVGTAYGTPTVNGTIDAAEWVDAQVLTIDQSNSKVWTGDYPAGFKIVVRTLWDETGFYMAGEITDSAVSYAADGAYGGNGFQASLDVGQVFTGTTETRAIFYSWGLYEGAASVTRQEAVNNGVVYDGDQGLIIKTVKTATGWNFEVLLPWTMLAEDVKLKASKDISPAAGFKINAMICYLDGDGNGGITAALGTTITDENTAYDWGPNDHGITYTLNAPVITEEVIEVETTAPAAATPSTPSTTPSTTAPQTTSPQTSDNTAIYLIAALGAAALLIIHFQKYYLKKHRYL